jgi:hypothetical protein
MRPEEPNPDLAFLERTLRFQEGSLSADEMPEFDREIRNDPHKRRLFIEAQERSLAIRKRFLAEDRPPLGSPRTVVRWRSWISHPIWAAAAGLILGLFSATLISGEIAPFRNKLLLSTKLAMLEKGAPPPSGIPTEPGKWTGDYTEVVSAENGVTPHSGARMLRLHRADHEGKLHPEGSRVGNVWYLVDLRPFRSQSALGALELRASFCFNSSGTTAPETHSCALNIHAVTAEFVSSGLLSNGQALINQNLAASSRRSPKIDSDPQTWEKLSAELRLPPKADFALVSFNLAAPEPKDRKEIVRFEGKYMDDLQISLVRR